MMWRWLFALFAWVLLSAQVELGFPPGTFQDRAPLDAASGGCAEATSFLSRTSGLDATHQTAYTVLICGIVTDGVWTSLDVLYIFATQDATTAVLNLVSSSFPASPQLSPTFTADQGYQGNGITQYIKTGFVPSTAGGNFTQNSASYGLYDRTNTADTNAYQMGASDGTAGAKIIVYNGASTLARINTGDGDFVSHSQTDFSGMYIVSRTASNLYALYKNGSSQATDAAASTGNPSQEFYILALNNSGLFNSLTTDQLAAAFIGGALDATKASNLSSRINAFMTTVGANVY